MSPKALCAFLLMVVLLFAEEASSQRGDVQQTGNNRSGGNRNTECVTNGGYNWITCIMLRISCNPKSCKRFKHLHKKIKCVVHKERCGGCKAKYFLDGKELQCDSIKQKGYECPPGVKKFDCNTNPCESTTCDTPEFRIAECKTDFCGGCFARYYVDQKWQRCPVSVLNIQPDAKVAASEAEIKANSGGAAFASVSRQAKGTDPFRKAPKARRPQIKAPICPNGLRALDCPPHICRNAVCPSYPNAKCRINNCGGCKPEFRMGFYVIENCYSNECPNSFPFWCRDDPCKYSTCVNYEHLKPVCKPSRCGGCRAIWSVDGKEIDCSKKPDNGGLCPDGRKMSPKCGPNICRFTKCPGDRTITCTVNHCGCYADYRDINNKKVKCKGWWTMPQRKRKTMGKSQSSIVDREQLLDAPPTINPVIPDHEKLGFEPLELHAPVQAVSALIRKPEDAQARRQTSRTSKRTNTLKEKPVKQTQTLNVQTINNKDMSVGNEGRNNNAHAANKQQSAPVQDRVDPVIPLATTELEPPPVVAPVKTIVESVIPSATIKVKPPPIVRQAHRSTSQAIDSSIPVNIGTARQQAGNIEPISDSRRAPRKRVQDTRSPPFKPVVTSPEEQLHVRPTTPKLPVQKEKSKKTAPKASDFSIINRKTGRTISIPPGLFDLLLQSMNQPGVPVQVQNSQRTR